MAHEHDDQSCEAAHRLTDVLTRMAKHVRDEFEIDDGAIAAALVSAGVRVARADMGPTACAAWLGDIAAAVERDPHPDTAGSA